MVSARLQALGISVPSRQGEHRTQCPQCSQTRRKKRDRCLSVRIDHDGAVFHCWHCDWSSRALDSARSQIVREHVQAGIKPNELKPDLVDEAARSLASGAETDAVTAYERAAIRSVQTAEPQRMVPGEVTERIPAAVYGQVNANPVLAHINSALETAKGSARTGLIAARRALMTPAGEIDATVEGLHGSRMAIADMVSEAKRAGCDRRRGWRDGWAWNDNPAPALGRLDAIQDRERDGGFSRDAHESAGGEGSQGSRLGPHEQGAGPHFAACLHRPFGGHARSGKREQCPQVE
jgi:hypothetical protein